ncbi:hypothetical protein BC830DRAFT_517736 [Chytriomyces sp. MP71]|nr:hypothetical protein BC830DRAFT_517736 [Chytriomyces sp. MP71]
MNCFASPRLQPWTRRGRRSATDTRPASDRETRPRLTPICARLRPQSRVAGDGSASEDPPASAVHAFSVRFRVAEEAGSMDAVSRLAVRLRPLAGCEDDNPVEVDILIVLARNFPSCPNEPENPFCHHLHVQGLNQ